MQQQKLEAANQLVRKEVLDRNQLLQHLSQPIIILQND